LLVALLDLQLVAADAEGPQAIQSTDGGLDHAGMLALGALDQALQWGYVARNVADAVDAPKFERFEWTRLDLDGVRLLLAAANDVPLSALWATAAYSGGRQGELLGLRWQDINFDAGTLSVVQTLVKIEEGRPIFGEPKKKNSRRTIKLSRIAFDILRGHRQRQVEQRLLLGPDYND
jgi:integrase